MRRHLLSGLVVAASLIVVGCSGGAATLPVTTGATGAPSSVSSAVPPGVPSATPAGGIAIAISGFTFGPSTMTVAAGTAVTWTNRDPVRHTVTFSDGSGSGTLGEGEAFSRTFDTPGTYAYHCRIHPSMKGEIVVK